MVVYNMKVNVYIVSAGPGDPELITVKGQKIIEESDYIFQSSRYVQDEMLKDIKEDCQVFDNFQYSYDDKLSLAKKAQDENKILSFLAMGDPALYGMVGGLVDRFEKNSINYEIIPGVNSAFAASASLKKGFTGLGGTNTFICTSYKDLRQEDNIDRIANTDSTVAFFMSLNKLEEIVALFEKYRTSKTPVAIVSKASWHEEEIIEGNLEDIVEKYSNTDIEDGLIIIGDILDMDYDYDLERRFMEEKKKQKNKNNFK